MIEIKDYTTKVPLQMIGDLTGVCWGADSSSDAKNIQRAIDCFECGHGRVEEFPDVYLVIDGYSAKMIRELYTHIGGGPTRLQASTRYIDYSKGFKAITPYSVEKNNEAMEVWNETLFHIRDGMSKLKVLGIPKEDYTNLLPLAYDSKMVWKVNLRTLINFMNRRLCSRAYWEIRKFSNELKNELKNYSEEWARIADAMFVPNCEAVGYCTEKKSCGKKPDKKTFFSNSII